MRVQVVGCSHRNTSIALRERLSFSPAETREALNRFRAAFPEAEAVLLSTCNRVELYCATEGESLPAADDIVTFLAGCRGVDASLVREQFYHREGSDGVRHLFAVASSLDSMVVGEAQILGQVKQACRLATEQGATGPLLHPAFQAAVAVARRVANETTIHQRRLSIPSIAVADFAKQIFERFEDKHTVVIGAGEMAEETLRYLRNEGARQITVVNRSLDRGEELAARWQGKAAGWDQLVEALATADLAISATAAAEPIVSRELFARIERSRVPRPMFILDLAVPRDFDAAIGDRPDVYLYCIDDLKAACERNLAERDRELPAAMRIVEADAARFMRDWYHRAARPVIERLRLGWEKPKQEELQRLLQKLPALDERGREEVRRAFDRLVNKLLHPPLESLRDEARRGVPRGLLDALAKLFRLRE